MTDEQILATLRRDLPKLPWTLDPNRGVCAPMADGPRAATVDAWKCKRKWVLRYAIWRYADRTVNAEASTPRRALAAIAERVAGLASEIQGQSVSVSNDAMRLAEAAEPPAKGKAKGKGKAAMPAP